jgi:hypothetical protein
MCPTEIAPLLSSPALSLQDLELRLSAFIQLAHSQSQARRYSHDQTLHLLDRAWEAQKLLWQLRRQNDWELQREFNCDLN